MGLKLEGLKPTAIPKSMNLPKAVPVQMRKPIDLGRIVAYDPVANPWLKHGGAIAEAASGGGVMDAETYGLHLSEDLSVRLAYALARISGNTYDQIETEVLVKYGQPAARKPHVQAVEIRNSSRVIENICDRIADIVIDAPNLTAMNEALVNGLVAPVRFQEDPERLSGLAMLCSKVSACDDPFEASFALFAGVAYLEPFAWGNGRTARIASIVPLVRAGLSPFTLRGLDKEAYAVAMRDWTVNGDIEPLSSRVEESYRYDGPAFLRTHAFRRKVHAVQLRMRTRFNTGISDYMRERIRGNGISPETFARQAFVDLEGKDLEIIVSDYVDVMLNMNENIYLAYRVTDALLAEYLAAVGNKVASP